MAWTDIELCWRTTDGKIFTNPDEAEKHQDEIDIKKHVDEFRERMKPEIDKMLEPLKKYIEEQTENKK